MTDQWKGHELPKVTLGTGLGSHDKLHLFSEALEHSHMHLCSLAAQNSVFADQQLGLSLFLKVVSSFGCAACNQFAKP